MVGVVGHVAVDAPGRSDDPRRRCAVYHPTVSPKPKHALAREHAAISYPATIGALSVATGPLLPR